MFYSIYMKSVRKKRKEKKNNLISIYILELIMFCSIFMKSVKKKSKNKKKEEEEEEGGDQKDKWFHFGVN